MGDHRGGAVLAMNCVLRGAGMGALPGRSAKSVAFAAGNVALLAALFEGEWAMGGFALLVIVVSLVVQGRGHELEPVPPESSTGPGNAAMRIMLEQ